MSGICIITESIDFRAEEYESPYKKKCDKGGKG